MHHYWNNNVAQVEDGVGVVGSGKVDINSVHQKQQQHKPPPLPLSIMYQ